VNRRRTGTDHLKWKLINQDGLSVEEANKRMEELKEYSKKPKLKFLCTCNKKPCPHEPKEKKK